MMSTLLPVSVKSNSVRPGVMVTTSFIGGERRDICAFASKGANRDTHNKQSMRAIVISFD
jgi:hypothetical protein